METLSLFLHVSFLFCRFQSVFSALPLVSWFLILFRCDVWVSSSPISISARFKQIRLLSPVWSSPEHFQRQRLQSLSWQHFTVFECPYATRKILSVYQTVFFDSWPIAIEESVALGRVLLSPVYSWSSICTQQLSLLLSLLNWWVPLLSSNAHTATVLDNLGDNPFDSLLHIIIPLLLERSQLDTATPALSPVLNREETSLFLEWLATFLIGFLCCKNMLLTHIQLVVKPDPEVLEVPV